MKKLALTLVAILALSALAAAGQEQPVPPGLVSVPEAGVFWPYTGTDYSGAPSDPVNLVFLGDADPRLIRQALLALDGDRAAWGLPPVFPFNCKWADAIGRPQAGYSDEAGWQGSAVQLECGSYATVRTHLRLFRSGPYTLGGAHFEVQIPGTSEHEVLSWEFPELLVKIDLLRSGLVTSLASTDPITPVPSFRAIRYQVLNGVPDALRSAIGLPTGKLTANVPISNDGVATILALAGTLQPAASDVVVEFDHPFGQAIPKPFCAESPADGLYVSGKVHMVHRVRTDGKGRYSSHFVADGTLTVVPISLATGQATGAPYFASVEEMYRSRLTDRDQTAALSAEQSLLADPAQSLVEKLWTGQPELYLRQETCGY
jgi:hypothetical protein